MNVPALVHDPKPLPVLVQRAADALLSAKSSAEILDAKDMANVAYHASKQAGRMAQVKEAHDTLLAEVYRAQADALLIEAQAKVRLADEYDAAQEAGEVARIGDNLPSVTNGNSKPTAADIGLSRKDIHDARQVRDAEASKPGLSERALNAMVERGEEPTRAALKREIVRATPSKPKPKMRREPLWVWGRIKDFDRDGILDIAPTQIASEMTKEMRSEVRVLLPDVIDYLEHLGREL